MQIPGPMPRFPSLDFLQQLQKRAEEAPQPKAAPGSGDALVGLDLESHPFVIQFEDGIPVAAALGDDPSPSTALRWQLVFD